jgi:hypothetical protein
LTTQINIPTTIVSEPILSDEISFAYPKSAQHQLTAKWKKKTKKKIINESGNETGDGYGTELISVIILLIL